MNSLSSCRNAGRVIDKYSVGKTTTVISGEQEFVYYILVVLADGNHIKLYNILTELSEKNVR